MELCGFLAPRHSAWRHSAERIWEWLQSAYWRSYSETCCLSYMPSVIMPSVIMPCHYATCHYAECHYAKCHYAKCHYAECHYAECHGAWFLNGEIVAKLRTCKFLLTFVEFHIPSGACTITLHGFITYTRMDTFHCKLVPFLLSVTDTLAWTNTLAYYGIHRLRIRNAFIV